MKLSLMAYVEVGFMDDKHFYQLLQYLGLSWRGYRKVRKGVKKRISRHMRQLGCQNMTAYLEKLEKKEEDKKHCEQMMTVPISRFFRDRKLWEVLGNEISELIQDHKEEVNVWSAGCACGEEVYSLKIIWHRLAALVVHPPKLRIIATDMNPVCLQRAKAALYRSSSLREVPVQFRSLYFHENSDRKLYAVKDFLKKDIEWRRHHLSSDTPGSQFHIVLLRNNLLTYYQEEFKKSAFQKVVNCICDGGILIIGSHEELPFENPCLLPNASLSFVFRKKIITQNKAILSTPFLSLSAL